MHAAEEDVVDGETASITEASIPQRAELGHERHHSLDLALVAGAALVVAGLAQHLLHELLDLCVLGERDPAELLDVLLALEIGFADGHASVRSLLLALPRRDLSAVP